MTQDPSTIDTRVFNDGEKVLQPSIQSSSTIDTKPFDDRHKDLQRSRVDSSTVDAKLFNDGWKARQYLANAGIAASVMSDDAGRMEPHELLQAFENKG